MTFNVKHAILFSEAGQAAASGADTGAPGGKKEKERNRIMKENFLVRATKLLLDIMFYAGIAVIVTLPVSIRIYGRFNGYFARYYVQLILLFAVSGILAELILYELRRMFRTVLANDCFVEANVKSLDRMGTYSFLIALVTAGRMVLYLTPAVLIIILVFVIAGLFSKVLSQVFDRAVAYKLENDLTI